MNYLPANLGIGIGILHEFSDDHTIAFTGELNRLLVPTPSTVNETGDPNIFDFQEKSVLQGMLSSFGDAPGGPGEDFNENMYSLGIEYRYKFIIGRIGHFNEHRTKGNRKLLGTGIGVRFEGIGFDVSYVGTLKNRSPMEGWSVTFSYDFKPVGKQPVLNK